MCLGRSSDLDQKASNYPSDVYIFLNDTEERTNLEAAIQRLG